MESSDYHAQFFTATVLEWKHLLRPDKYKEVLIKSMGFLVEEGRARIFGFCIMSNHLHIMWQIGAGHRREDVQRDFLRFTAQAMLFDLKKNHPAVLDRFEVNLRDRKHQIWERNPLSVDLYTRDTLNSSVRKIDNIV